MRSLLSAQELYKQQWKRHSSLLHGLSVSPKITSETLSARNTSGVPTQFLLLTLGIRWHRLLCFSNKDPNPSRFQQQRFLSFSHECPPAAGSALHHPHSRPRLMKQPIQNTLLTLTVSDTALWNRQQQLNAPTRK